MTLITPFGKPAAPDEILALAETHFVRAIKELDRVLKNLEAGGEDAQAVARAAAEARKATQILFEERNRVEQCRKKTDGGTGSYALDLDAARDEIGRRLARLREARGPGGIPG